MGYNTDGLTFNTLRQANLRRLPLFLNGKGERAHSTDNGSDWSLNDWYTAMSGEVGELGNFLKKIRRGDFTVEDERLLVARELADVAIYLDILAFRCGVDLGEAVMEKWNQTCRNQGINLRLDADGWHYRWSPNEPEPGL